MGVGEIPLFEMLRAYTVFSDAGKFCEFVATPGERSECKDAASPGAALEIENILTNRSYKLREF